MKNLSRAAACALLLSLTLVSAASAASPKKKETVTNAAVEPPKADPNAVDWAMVSRIRYEAFHNSHVMETMSSITDSIGPRLTNSPNMRKANAWTRDQLTKFGLQNAHLEPWGPFGRGWSYETSTVRMLTPDVAELTALPKAFTPGTEGPVRGRVIAAKITKVEDFEKYRGKLQGQIVLLGEMRVVKAHEAAELKRYDEKGLADLYSFEVPADRDADKARAERITRIKFTAELTKFLEAEKPLAVIEPSRIGDGGTIFVQGGGSYKTGEPVGAPDLVMGIEHFGRISRLIERNEPVELEVNVKTKFYEDDPYGYNTIAEIPGTDPKLKDEVVMLGGHLDSWHGSTGATDNAAGCSVMMEAVRILQTLGVKPRRTIRIALWSGEEQGLLGSRGYVTEHFGSRAPSADPKEKELPPYAQSKPGPLSTKPDYNNISAYFNVDEGTGKLRGIFLQENEAVAPIFKQWMEPFADLGMTTLAMKSVSGSDFLSFDAIGVPGFAFIQDPVEYDSRTHHSNMDSYERIQREDLMQASAIVASFVYNAAMRDEKLPRKPVPDFSEKKADDAKVVSK